MELILPLLQEQAVHSKMTNFHSKIAALEMSKCITCLERFPALNVKADSPDSEDTECVHCRQDEHIPKVYSSSNNMDPGPVVLTAQFSCSACSGLPHNACISTSYKYSENTDNSTLDIIPYGTGLEAFPRMRIQRVHLMCHTARCISTC